MSRDAVEEEAVVRHDEHGAGKAQDRLLQRAQRADVQVVRGLVEDEDLCGQRPVRQGTSRRTPTARCRPPAPRTPAARDSARPQKDL